MKLYAQTLGGRLKELREGKSLLQKELCDKLGIEQRNYSKYETDQIKRPNPEVVKKLADFYKIPVDVIMTKDNSLSHIPDKILDMLRHEDSVPFLMKAYKEYQEYLEEKQHAK